LAFKRRAAIKRKKKKEKRETGEPAQREASSKGAHFVLNTSCIELRQETAARNLRTISRKGGGEDFPRGRKTIGKVPTGTYSLGQEVNLESKNGGREGKEADRGNRGLAFCKGHADLKKESGEKKGLKKNGEGKGKELNVRGVNRGKGPRREVDKTFPTQQDCARKKKAEGKHQKVATCNFGGGKRGVNISDRVL